jgi:CelD/BcsL family acetyltransferase involved in cellulose biosynthesis
LANIAELVQAPMRPADGVPTLACVPWRTIENRIAEWDALAARASEPNPFYESWYLLPSLRVFDAEGDVSIVVLEMNGKLAGLMPLLRQRRYYGWPFPNLSGWLHGNCFLGAPLVATDAEHAFWRSLLAWTDESPRAALFLHLRQIPLAGPLHDALRDVLAEQCRPASVVHREERAMLASPLSPDDYLEAAMSGKKRKELRRQFARLSEMGTVRFERRDDDEALDDWTETFLALEAAGWKGRAASALSSEAETAQLFREALSGAAARGRLERLTLLLDERPVAMLATFLTSPGAYSFKTAFDERLSRFSPGVLLQRENLAMLERGGIDWTDSCAAADHPMIDHIWRERRGVGAISIAIGGTLRRALFGNLLRAELRRQAGRQP